MDDFISNRWLDVSTPSNLPIDPASTTMTTMQVNHDAVNASLQREYIAIQQQRHHQLEQQQLQQQQLSMVHNQPPPPPPPPLGQHPVLPLYQPATAAQLLYRKRNQHLDHIQLPRQQSLPASLEQHSPLDRFSDPQRGTIIISLINLFSSLAFLFNK